MEKIPTLKFLHRHLVLCCFVFLMYRIFNVAAQEELPDGAPVIVTDIGTDTVQ